MASGLSWSWSAVSASAWSRRDGCWVKLVLAVVSSSHGICQEGVLRRPKVVSKDFLKLVLSYLIVRLSEISSEKSYLNEKKAAVICLVGWAGSAAVVGCIPRVLLRLVVRMQTPRSGVWLGGEDADPMLQREETNSSPAVSGSPAAEWLFVVRPTDCTSVAQGLFKWVRAQGRSPDTPGGSKNASGTVGIPLQRGTSGIQR